jgi:hypothetical protein
VSSPIEQLQADLHGRIVSLDELSGVFVALARPRDKNETLLIETKLDQALGILKGANGKSGAAMIVQMPVVTVPNPDLPGPRLVAKVTVRVMENPLINMGGSGTQLSAETLGLEILNKCHMWQRSNHATVTADAEAMVPVLEDKAVIAYDVTLTQPLGLAPVANTLRPSIAVAGYEITLTCGETARIYYTTDGTFPGPSNPAAGEYTAAVTLQGACTVRAAAFAAGKPGSPILEQSIT